jgi:hypothetical protein
LRAAASLHVSVEKVENDVAYLVKPLVALVLGVDEMFYLRHGELAHAKQTRTRRNLVPERTPDLRRGEWNAAIVEFQESGEVQKVTLRRFRA